MSQATRRLSCFLTVLCLYAMLTSPLLADILVMQDGSRLEIEGEWREKGRVIHFTLPNGTLGSVRATEVDLDASREATQIANAPPAEEPPETMEKEKPAPIAVWTNEDIPQAAPDVLASASAAVDAQTVQVTDWVAEPGSGNVVTLVRGTLQNYGNNVITELRLAVTVTGDRANGTDPTLVRQARLEASELGPGETTEFSVEVRRGDVASVGTVEEFESPSASFQVLFESNPQDENGGEGAGDSDDSDEG